MSINVNEITFGIEIETHLPAGVVAVGAYHVGNEVAGLPAGWKAMRDGSICAPAGREGCEFVSPVLKGADGIRQVLEVVAKLKALGADVNASCGFHVHVGYDVADVAALERLITLVANFEKAIYASTGTKNRESGTWCKGVQRHGDVESAKRVSGCDRYHVLNLTNLLQGRRPTVEFRAFSGTLNAVKIVSYIRLCVGLVERSLVAPRKAAWTAKPVADGSPRKRSGDGQTALCSLFYQLGWTKGRTPHTHGDLHCEYAPTIKDSKRELMRLARKYDRE